MTTSATRGDSAKAARPVAPSVAMIATPVMIWSKAKRMRSGLVSSRLTLSDCRIAESVRQSAPSSSCSVSMRSPSATAKLNLSPLMTRVYWMIARSRTTPTNTSNSGPSSIGRCRPVRALPSSGGMPPPLIEASSGTSSTSPMPSVNEVSSTSTSTHTMRKHNRGSRSSQAASPNGPGEMFTAFAVA